MFSKGQVFSRPVVIGLVLIIGGLVVGLLGSRVAQAYSTGISGHSGNPGTNGGMTCNACHGGGQVPVVTLTGPASVTPGSTHTYVLAVQSTNPSVQTYAGRDVSATAGNLAPSGADTQVMGSLAAVGLFVRAGGFVLQNRIHKWRRAWTKS